MNEVKAIREGEFTIVDTLIPNETFIRIDQMSGRQGDNKRVVNLALKQGTFVKGNQRKYKPFNLQNKHVEIQVKDADDVVKSISRVSSIRSASSGLISIEMPKEAYLAVGDTHAGFIRVLDDNEAVVTSVNIVFTVYPNEMEISSDKSQTYIDSVARVAEEAQAKLEPLKASIDDANNDMQLLGDKVSKYTDLVNSTRPDDKLEYMALSMTFSENEPQRYTDVLNRYKETVSVISLIDMLNISSNTASDVTSSPLTMLQAKIDEAKGAGYKINLLKPHIGPNRSDGFTKYKYVPDNIDTFFARYKTILLDHAKLCVDNSIPVLSISNELNMIIGQNYLSYWQDIVSAIRSAYPTLKLTAAIAGPYTDDQQVLYPLVDYIGVNWYPAYTYKLIKTVSDIPSEAELGQGLLYSHINDSQNPDGKSDLAIIASLAKKYKKPIWFTESGVMPKPDGLNHLLSSQMDAPDMFEITAAALHTFFDNVATIGSVAGISWWHGQEPFNLGLIDVSAKTIAEKAWIDLEGEYLIK